jgi:hypothetical protein
MDVTFPSTSVYFLFYTADLIWNAQIYEISCVLWQICTVATAVKAMLKYCGRNLDVI